MGLDDRGTVTPWMPEHDPVSAAWTFALASRYPVRPQLLDASWSALTTWIDEEGERLPGLVWAASTLIVVGECVSARSTHPMLIGSPLACKVADDALMGDLTGIGKRLERGGLSTVSDALFMLVAETSEADLAPQVIAAETMRSVVREPALSPLAAINAGRVAHTRWVFRDAARSVANPAKSRAGERPLREAEGANEKRSNEQEESKSTEEELSE